MAFAFLLFSDVMLVNEMRGVGPERQKAKRATRKLRWPNPHPRLIIAQSRIVRRDAPLARDGRAAGTAVVLRAKWPNFTNVSSD